MCEFSDEFTVCLQVSQPPKSPILGDFELLFEGYRLSVFSWELYQ